MQSENLAEAKPPLCWPTVSMFILTTIGALVLTPLYGYYHGFDTFEWVFFFVLLAYTGMSITGGYHRLWAHKAYKSHFLLRVFYAFGGAGALQNTVFDWASDHRRHHRFVDDYDKDPYSIKRGFWFAHLGWMIREYHSRDGDYANIKDLLQDPVLKFQDRYYFQIVFVFNVILPLFVGWLHGDMLASFLLAGVTRLVVMHHCTFFINSLAHMWGRRPYTDTNTARDNDILAFFTWGEGYHNYHHIFQWDYRNGIRWWHWDPTKWLIFACSKVGLAWELKRVPKSKIEKSIIDMQFKNTTNSLKKYSKCFETDFKMLEKQYEDLIKAINDWTSFKSRWCHVKRQELLASWENSQLFKRYLELKSAVESQRLQWHELREQFA